jgi:hypothetical protein
MPSASISGALRFSVMPSSETFGLDRIHGMYFA